MGRLDRGCCFALNGLFGAVSLPIFASIGLSGWTTSPSFEWDALGGALSLPSSVCELLGDMLPHPHLNERFEGVVAPPSIVSVAWAERQLRPRWRWDGMGGH